MLLDYDLFISVWEISDLWELSDISTAEKSQKNGLVMMGNNQNNDQMDVDELISKINNMTYSEICGTRPWKFVKEYQNIYPEGNKSGKSYSGKYENHNYNLKFSQQVPRNRRIIQGNKADYGEWPWQISIRKWKNGIYENIHIKNGKKVYEVDYDVWPWKIRKLKNEVSSSMEPLFINVEVFY